MEIKMKIIYIKIELDQSKPFQLSPPSAGQAGPPACSSCYSTKMKRKILDLENKLQSEELVAAALQRN